MAVEHIWARQYGAPRQYRFDRAIFCIQRQHAHVIADRNNIREAGFQFAQTLTNRAKQYPLCCDNATETTAHFDHASCDRAVTLGVVLDFRWLSSLGRGIFCAEERFFQGTLALLLTDGHNAFAAY